MRNKKEGGEFKKQRIIREQRIILTGNKEGKVSKTGVWWAVSIADKLLVMVEGKKWSLENLSKSRELTLKPQNGRKREEKQKKMGCYLLMFGPAGKQKDRLVGPLGRAQHF